MAVEKEEDDQSDKGTYTIELENPNAEEVEARKMIDKVSNLNKSAIVKTPIHGVYGGVLITTIILINQGVFKNIFFLKPHFELLVFYPSLQAMY